MNQNYLKLIKNLSLGLAILTFGCGEDIKYIKDLPEGEACQSTDDCAKGVCYNNICRNTCETNFDCGPKQYCYTENAISLCINTADGSCREGFTGSYCKDCDSGYYGSNCDQKCNCGSNQHCDKEGGCLTNPQNTCPEGFIGKNCDQCDDGYFGEKCDPCTCKHGKCNHGINGDGFCREESCAPHFQGKNCDQCTEGYYGEDCHKPTCVNGELDTTTGTCKENSCDDAYKGINCDQCADSRFTGPQCDQCADSRFTGPSCDECADSRFTGSKCNECANSHFTGPNCDQCATGFTGTDCAVCNNGTTGTMQDAEGNSYKTVCIASRFWMAENMRMKTGKYYSVNDDSSKDNTYGLLYNFDTAKNICPQGWQLPTTDNINSLLAFLHANRKSDSSFLALIAKSPDWVEYSNQGGDDFSFGALPAGWPNELIEFFQNNAMLSGLNIDLDPFKFGYGLFLFTDDSSWFTIASGDVGITEIPINQNIINNFNLVFTASVRCVHE